MNTSFHAVLLAGVTAGALALGAMAAHADEASSLQAAQQHAAALDEATGGDNLVSKATNDPDFMKAAEDFAKSDEAAEVGKALMDLIGDGGTE